MELVVGLFLLENEIILLLQFNFFTLILLLESKYDLITFRWHRFPWWSLPYTVSVWSPASQSASCFSQLCPASSGSAPCWFQPNCYFCLSDSLCLPVVGSSISLSIDIVAMSFPISIVFLVVFSSLVSVFPYLLRGNYCLFPLSTISNSLLLYNCHCLF